MAYPSKPPSNSGPAISDGVHHQRAGQLYMEHGPLVYRRCLSLLGDAELAAIHTQQVFIRLLHVPGGFERRPGLARWLFDVTTLHCEAVLAAASQPAERRGSSRGAGVTSNSSWRPA